MAEEFYVDAADSDSASLVERKLAALTVDGAPLMKAERQSASVFTGCLVNDGRVGVDANVRAESGEAAAFSELFEQIHTMRSGRHHSHGLLWVQTGKHQVVEEPVSLCDVAPTVLGHFGLEPPSYMEGRNLIAPMENRQPIVAA